jgi:hypothetical protein
MKQRQMCVKQRAGNNRDVHTLSHLQRPARFGTFSRRLATTTRPRLPSLACTSASARSPTSSSRETCEGPGEGRGKRGG